MMKELRNMGPSFKVTRDKNSLVSQTDGRKINDPMRL